MNIPFSPPDISECEIESVVETRVPDGSQQDRRQRNLKNKLRHMWGRIVLSV